VGEPNLRPDGERLREQFDVALGASACAPKAIEPSKKERYVARAIEVLADSAFDRGALGDARGAAEGGQPIGESGFHVGLKTNPPPSEGLLHSGSSPSLALSGGPAEAASAWLSVGVAVGGSAPKKPVQASSTRRLADVVRA
jgi:hypothetical protein